ncbi:MAG: prepilin-type N-terminal cleavage/methylation domain-containing protein [Planctomycetaceae bacterium]
MIRRRGFTLFEVVVALALSVLLLAGIYAGMDLYWRFSTTGQEEVERAQIARAVLRQIETDLRSVVYQSPEMIAAATASVAAPSGSAMGLAASGGSSTGAMGATGTSGGAGGAGGGSMGGAQSGMSGGGTSAGGGRAPTGGGGSASTAGGSGGGSAGGGSGGGTTGGTSGSLGGGSSAGGTGSASGGASAGGAGSASGIAGVGAAGAGTSGSGVVSGLFGTQDSLRLTAAAPSRKAVYVPLGSQVPGMARACDLLTVGYQLGDASQTMSAQPSGLARLEGDRLQQELARQNGDTQTQMAGLQMLAPEVTGLTFAYFDGYQWRSDWDSQALGGLPMAVEVLLEITTPPRVFRPGNPASSRQPTTQSFRLVVSLPLAKAIDTSTLE